MFFNKRVMRGRQGGDSASVLCCLCCFALLSFVVFCCLLVVMRYLLKPCLASPTWRLSTIRRWCLSFPRNAPITEAVASLQGIQVFRREDEQRGNVHSDHWTDCTCFLDTVDILRRPSSISIDWSNRLNNCQTSSPELDTMMQNRLFVLQWLNLPFGNHFQ